MSICIGIFARDSGPSSIKSGNSARSTILWSVKIRKSLRLPPDGLRQRRRNLFGNCSLATILRFSSKYQLPLLRNHFHACHALIERPQLSITPIQPLVHLFPSFEECRRRVYMSATIADDSSIVRTFDADSETVKKPIVPETLAGVGERMILVPSLTKIAGNSDRTMAQKAAESVAANAGVVVLVPSEGAANRWSSVARLMIKTQVEQAVEGLVTGADRGPFVFANRYDGIDLNGEACRLLVMDGLPKGANTYELFRSQGRHKEQVRSILASPKRWNRAWVGQRVVLETTVWFF